MTHHQGPQPTNRAELLSRALRCRCPNCGTGPVFAGLVQMHERCPTCSYRFVRENGYFLGAMVINYAIVGALALAGAAIAWLVTQDRVQTAITPFVIAIVGVPLLLRHSRMLWMALDLAAEPPRPDEFCTP